MGIAVELCFDREAERAVRGVWEAVREATGSGLLFDLRARPHVSLAVYFDPLSPRLRRAGGAGEEAPKDALARFRGRPTPFVLASGGTFPGDEGVAFLAPVVDEALLRLHREWHALAPGGDPYYAPGAWVPHCTVGFRLPDVAPALAAARAALPIRGRFESVALVEFERDLSAPVRCLVERPLVTA